jgi:uncharacterized membrane protein
MEPKRNHNSRRGRWPLRIAAMAGGGALAGWGISRRDKLGIALASAGGLLVYSGLRPGGQRGIHFETSMTINRPAEEVFRYWRNFQNLPLFMSHLQEVRVTGDRSSEWKARGPMGTTVSWQAEITDEKPDQWIVWRSLPGADLDSVGSVQFRPAPGNRGTELTVALDYQPAGGQFGRLVAAMFGRDPEMTIREDLRNFKHIMEAGEIPTIKGQPSGERSAVVSLLNAAMPEYRSTAAQDALRSA